MPLGNFHHSRDKTMLVIAFVSALCGATFCAEMAAFGQAKEHVFRDFLTPAMPCHRTTRSRRCSA